MDSTEALIKRWVGRSTPGIAYVHFDRRQVLFERYAGTADLASQRLVDAQTSFHGFSVTKTMTALAVLQLAEQGRIRLDEPARRYLPSMPYPDSITVRHLLTHTAGLPNPLPLSWIHPPEDIRFDRDGFFAVVFAKHAKLRSAPGDRFSYSNLGYVLLGQLLEQLTGQRYEDLIRAMILHPSGIAPVELGFEHPPLQLHATGYIRTPSMLSLVLPFMVDTKRMFGERTGRWRAFRPFLLNGAAYGGSLGTASGYRKYLQALLSRDRLIGDAHRDLLFSENRTTNGQGTGMCMSWFTGSLNGHHYRSHAGGGGGYYAELRVYPALGRGSVALFNRTGVRDERLLDQLDAAWLPS